MLISDDTDSSDSSDSGTFQTNISHSSHSPKPSFKTHHGNSSLADKSKVHIPTNTSNLSVQERIALMSGKSIGGLIIKNDYKPLTPPKPKAASRSLPPSKQNKPQTPLKPRKELKRVSQGPNNIAPSATLQQMDIKQAPVELQTTVTVTTHAYSKHYEYALSSACCNGNHCCKLSLYS